MRSATDQPGTSTPNNIAEKQIRFDISLSYMGKSPVREDETLSLSCRRNIRHRVLLLHPRCGSLTAMPSKPSVRRPVCLPSWSVGDDRIHGNVVRAAGRWSQSCGAKPDTDPERHLGHSRQRSIEIPPRAPGDSLPWKPNDRRDHHVRKRRLVRATAPGCSRRLAPADLPVSRTGIPAVLLPKHDGQRDPPVRSNIPLWPSCEGPVRHEIGQ